MNVSVPLSTFTPSSITLKGSHVQFLTFDVWKTEGTDTTFEMNTTELSCDQVHSTLPHKTSLFQYKKKCYQEDRIVFSIILQLLSLFSQQPGWRKGMSLASQAQGLRFDPYQRHSKPLSVTLVQIFG